MRTKWHTREVSRHSGDSVGLAIRDTRRMSDRDRALPGESSICVDVERWRDALPADAWAGGLGVRDVYRADVFDVASRWRAGEVSSRALAAAALAWGFGPVGYGRFRTRLILEGDPNGERLDAALQGLRSEAPSESDLAGAFVAFRTSSRIKGLGPSFFTKLLYFAGYRRGTGEVQPLILDAVVARNLPPEAGIVSKPFRWRSTEWLNYLRWAASQGEEPDHVEIRHFVR